MNLDAWMTLLIIVDIAMFLFGLPAGYWVLKRMLFSDFPELRKMVVRK